MDIIRVMTVMSVTATMLFVAFWCLGHIFKDKFSYKQQKNLLLFIMLYFLFPLPLLKNYYFDLCTYLMDFVPSFMKQFSIFLGIRPKIYLFNGDTAFNSVALNLLIIGLVIWFAGTVRQLIPFVHGHFKILKKIYFNALLASDEHQFILSALKKLKRELHIIRPVQLRIAADIDTPMSYGVFWPTILLPDGYESMNSELEYIFRHELIHIRNNDFLIKVLCSLAIAIHWFNPLTKVLIRKIDIMSEFICDDGVTKNLSRPQRIAYGNVVLETAREYPITSAFSNVAINTFAYNDEDILTERMSRLRNPKKLPKSQLFLSMIASVAVIVLSSLTVFAFTETRVIENDIIASDGTVEAIEVSVVRDTPLNSTDIEEVTGFILNSNGEEVPVTEITERAPCNHSYDPVTYIKHIKYTDGTCKKEYYDAQECWKCHHTKVGAYQYSITFSKCDH